MELRQLEFFMRIAELRSFTKASIMLRVPQPVLSKQIRRLEVELRQALFNRNGRGITLTEEGAILLDHAKSIIKQVEGVPDALTSARSSPTGKVIIATPTVAAKTFAGGFITAFRERFPQASLQIIEGTSRMIQEWLLMGRADIGVLYDPPSVPTLDVRPLKTHEYSVFSLASNSPFPQGDAMPFSTLAKVPLILPSYPHSIRRMVEAAAAKSKIRLNVTFEIEGAALILEFVRCGHGCTILPDFSLTRTAFADQLQLNSLVKPRLSRTLNVATCSQHATTRLVTKTFELVVEQLGSHARNLSIQSAANCINAD